MKTLLPFTEAELAQMSDLIARYKYSLPTESEYHFQKWLELIEDTEQGYGGVYDEFLNEAWTRVTLGEMLVHLSAELRERVVAFLQPFDRRFLEATETRIRTSDDDSIWLSRIPKKNPTLDEFEFKSWRVGYVEPPLPFNEAELEQMSDALALEKKTYVSRSEHLLRRWVELIEEIETEFQGFYERFIDEVGSRARLDLMLVHLSAALRERVVAFLAPFDRRFFAGTELKVGTKKGEPLWLSRIPKKCSPRDEKYFKPWRLK
jgi:hypothetical protein